ncbi:phosphoenolpyruvate carboxylase, partial [Neisseria meningitidis]|uniref:phosphoenolpyruvate carboxylase n=1 Tax=Neisseria meningitidis TaxID=487 RepID=UPI001F0B8B61
MQLHILNNPKDAALAADAEFLKHSLFNLLHEEASPLVVETVKLLSVSDDSAALIEKVLPQLDEQQTYDLTLACGLFAQILNIAEDVHHERRRQIHEDAGHGGAEGSLTETVRRLKAGKADGKSVQRQLDNTSVTAVLTAHPTEVQRQTVLNFNRRIRALLPQRERCTNADALARLRREIDTILLGLWQTSETRRHKLSVNDEINNGVSIFPMSFFEALPKLYRKMEHDFQTAYPDVRVPDILKIGGWIGGDRDGNPFVSAETLRFAFRRHADAVFRFYRGELDKLYRELPLSIRRVKVNGDVMALSDKSPDEETAHAEEPYRRAIAYIMARAMGKARALGLGMGCKFGFLEPYASAQEFLDDLKKLQHSLIDNGSRLLAEGRLADLIRSVSVFGFHMMPLDLRQHAGKHADVVAELFQHAGLEDYNSLNEEQKQAALLRELSHQRPLYSPFITYS